MKLVHKIKRTDAASDEAGAGLLRR